MRSLIVQLYLFNKIIYSAVVFTVCQGRERLGAEYDLTPGGTASGAH